MYVCNHETGGGFFQGCARPAPRPLISTTRPPPIRELTLSDTRWPSSENTMAASLSVHPSEPSRGVATARREKAASFPLPHLPDRRSTPPCPSRPSASRKTLRGFSSHRTYCGRSAYL